MCIGKAQSRQKSFYDQKSRPPNFAVGERVFLFKPSEKTGEARKLARPYHGPYRVTRLDTNTAHICRVDRPQEEAILVALGRLRRCPLEIGEDFWPPSKPRRKAATVTRETSSMDTTAPQERVPADSGASTDMPVPMEKQGDK